MRRPSPRSSLRSSSAFERDAKMLASLNHPHIAQVHGLTDSPVASVIELVATEPRVNGNEPPVIRFTRHGSTMTGPAVGIAQTLSGTVGRPVPLTLWASDVPTREMEAEAALAARPRATNSGRGAESVAISPGTPTVGTRRIRLGARDAIMVVGISAAIRRPDRGHDHISKSRS